MNWTQVTFRFVGDSVSPERIAEALGGISGKVYVRGQDPKSSAPNSWRLESSLEANETIEAHLLGLLEKLLPHEEKIREFSELFKEPSFLCSLGGDEEGSACVANISYDTIQAMGRLNADLLLTFHR